MTVNTTYPVSVSINASSNPVCGGTSVTYIAIPINGGNSPLYQWKVNGINVGSNSQTYTYIPVNGDIVTCLLTSSYNCTTNNPATSNSINMIVNITYPISVSINPSSNPVCSGSSVIYTATPTNGGSLPLYQWRVNGINVGLNSQTYTYIPVNGDIVTCLLTSSYNCTTNNPVTSNSITMVVNNDQPVSITISSSANPVCSGTSVTYTAMPTNEGLNPFYQWQVNGLNAGINNPIYSYAPNNGDIITCILTSDATCPTGNPANSNTITMTINPNLPVSTSITASSNPSCEGSPVTFTVIPVNGGAEPSYQWQVNGINVGSGASIYSYIPTDNDSIICILSSSLSCITGNPSLSNPITMTVNSNLPVGISITTSSNPFCPGSSVTFNAVPINEGTSPSYEWKVNGTTVGTNSPTYSYYPNNGDSVRCIMTSSLICVINNPASSADIIMNGSLAPVVTFTSCFDTITTVSAKPIKLRGGIPIGGIYSGPGVNSATGIFTPSTAGTGTKTIIYTYTNVLMCSASQSLHVIVDPQAVFTCGNNLLDVRDNKVYPTIQLGSQCWMASNLNYGTELISTQNQRDNCISEKYCYNDSPINCINQGGLYQWDELMLYDDTPANQGFCPPGWHIPTENEWNNLFANWTNNGFAGSTLKYSGYSGFSALLSGENYFNKSWKYQNFATFFWSSTLHGNIHAWAYGINDPDPSVSAYPASRDNAFAVRCVVN
ncbi:MAG: FISUMP domain-containing protein [Bacteroidales bacterium]